MRKPLTEKSCQICYEVKPIEEFRNSRENRTKFVRQCRDCTNRPTETQLGIIEVKRCGHCGEVKPISEFYGDKYTRSGVNNWCIGCCRVRQREWHVANRELTKKRSRAYYHSNKEEVLLKGRNTHKENKISVMSWYGGECVCCQETFIDFLSLDHINDDGYEQRKTNASGSGSRLYRAIVKNGEENKPKDLQVLCMNCQWGKRFGNGFCIHHPEINLKMSKN